MAHFTKSDLEKEKLLEFCTPEGQEELYSYCHRPRRTILEILGDFPHTTPYIPINYLFDLIQPLQPRAFSIASSQLAKRNEIDLLMAVVKYKTKMFKPRTGVCSTWLSSLDPGKKKELIPVWIKKGTITLPPRETNVPLIMIGPGTGVAPFRNFVLERISRGVGLNYLFFGCRNEKMDYFFQDEWKSYCDKGQLTVIPAFSRDQDDKVYVQHKIKEHAALVWQLIDKQGAYIYVAGKAIGYYCLLYINKRFPFLNIIGLYHYYLKRNFTAPVYYFAEISMRLLV